MQRNRNIHHVEIHQPPPNTTQRRHEHDTGTEKEKRVANRKRVRIEQLQCGERVARRRGLVAPPLVEPTSKKNKFGFEGKVKRRLCV
jgi:LPS O-antigen subunit length determinant protein (WzzB/FepE family)